MLYLSTVLQSKERAGLLRKSERTPQRRGTGTSTRLTCLEIKDGEERSKWSGPPFMAESELHARPSEQVDDKVIANISKVNSTLAMSEVVELAVRTWIITQRDEELESIAQSDYNLTGNFGNPNAQSQASNAARYRCLLSSSHSRIT